MGNVLQVLKKNLGRIILKNIMEMINHKEPRNKNILMKITQ
jgi:hypothetical protein